MHWMSALHARFDLLPIPDGTGTCLFPDCIPAIDYGIHAVQQLT